jgi:hypothetical protein
MKNIIIITLDTDAEEPIKIGKPNDIPHPTTPEEISITIKNDIVLLNEALMYMIKMGSQNGYCDKLEVTNKCLKDLHSLTLEDTKHFNLEEPKLGEDEKTENKV